MPKTTPLTPNKGDFTDSELQTVLATLAGRDPGAVCAAIAVVIYHSDDDEHSLTVLADREASADNAADMLDHAAAHLRGKCRTCNRMRRETSGERRPH